MMTGEAAAVFNFVRQELVRNDGQIVHMSCAGVVDYPFADDLAGLILLFNNPPSPRLVRLRSGMPDGAFKRR